MKHIQLFFCFLFFILFSCKNGEKNFSPNLKNKSEEAFDNMTMVEILDSIKRFSDPQLAYNLNLKLAEMLKKEIDVTQDINKRSQLMFKYGSELLNGGKIQEAIQIFDSFLAVIRNQNLPVDENGKMIFDKLGIAYLRLGEQQNCINNHTSSSCIIPLQKEGFHQLKNGSETAIEIYTELLNRFPDDNSSKWLLNIAYMTLGKHPDGVPKKWLVPIPPFSDKNKLPFYKDIASSLGIDVLGLSGGANIEDFNNDGFLDIFITAYGLDEQSRMFFNDGKGGFNDVTIPAGLKGLVSGLNTIHADFNNDGFVDIFILRGGWLNLGGNIPNSLLKNNGDGTFSDVTKEAGVLSFHPTQTASWADFDNDGFVDLYIGNESINSANAIHPNEFYRNNGDGTFTDVANLYGLDIVAFCKGVNFGDINNDGLPDLYISIMGEQNKLYINRGGINYKEWKFEEYASKLNIDKPIFSFPNIFFDYNNDGNLDLLVFGYSSNLLLNLSEDAALEYLGIGSKGEKPRLYKNLGKEKFEEVGKSMNLNSAIYAMGCSVGDVDNDGYLDFYAGTGAPDLRTIVPNKFYKNNNGNSFIDETNAGFGHIQKGHGIAMGDLDNDGDEDIYCVQGGAYQGDVAYNVLFENPIKNTKWINLKLEGNTSNRSAIGAKVQVVYMDSKNITRNIYRWVGVGGTFGSSSLQLEIGLGSVKTIEKIIVQWPNKAKTLEVFNNVMPNKCYLIKEGKSSAMELEKKVIEFNKNSHQHNHH